MNTRTNFVETAVDNNQPILLGFIESDLNTGNWDALYFASEADIAELIDQGRIDEDFFSRHQDYREEMWIMLAEL